MFASVRRLTWKKKKRGKDVACCCLAPLMFLSGNWPGVKCSNVPDYDEWVVFLVEKRVKRLIFFFPCCNESHICVQYFFLFHSPALCSVWRYTVACLAHRCVPCSISRRIHFQTRQTITTTNPMRTRLEQTRAGCGTSCNTSFFLGLVMRVPNHVHRQFNISFHFELCSALTVTRLFCPSRIFCQFTCYSPFFFFSNVQTDYVFPSLELIIVLNFLTVSVKLNSLVQHQLAGLYWPCGGV